MLYVLQDLRLSTAGYGVILAACGAGSVLGRLCTAPLSRHFSPPGHASRREPHRRHRNAGHRGAFPVGALAGGVLAATVDVPTVYRTASAVHILAGVGPWRLVRAHRTTSTRPSRHNAQPLVGTTGHLTR